MSWQRHRHPALRPTENGYAHSLASLALTAVLALAWVLLQSATADLPAQVHRLEFYRRAGWSPVDTGWFGGRSPLAYSLLTPQPMATLGVGVTGLLAVTGPDHRSDAMQCGLDEAATPV